MAESVNKVPSKESLADYYVAIGQAIQELEKANPDVSAPIICGSALQLFLDYPYVWLGKTVTAERFVEVINTQAKEFIRLVAVRAQEAKVGG